MFFSQFSRRAIHVVLPLSFLAVALPGCKKASKTAAPAASGSAGAPAGPCADFAARVCKKAGDQAQSCQAMTVAVEFLSPAVCTAALADADFTMQKLAAESKTCDDLTKTLCKAIGPTTQTCEMVKSQTKQFTSDRCKNMLAHLPEVTQQLQQMEEQNKPLPAELQKTLTAGAVTAFGPESAAVQVVEFSDFQCPYCSRAADAVHKIKEKYGDRVRFTFRQFPLPMHPNAHGAAEAALAANAQGKFWEFHDRLFKNQQQLDEKGLEQQAKEAGLNVPQFKKSLSDHQFAPTVDAEVKLGEQAHVNGTPTMFVNGARIADPTNYDGIAQAIENALKGGAKPG
jgi:protein-disulfide isomerase